MVSAGLLNLMLLEENNWQIRNMSEGFNTQYKLEDILKFVDGDITIDNLRDESRKTNLCAVLLTGHVNCDRDLPEQRVKRSDREFENNSIFKSLYAKKFSAAGRKPGVK